MESEQDKNDSIVNQLRVKVSLGIPPTRKIHALYLMCHVII